MLHWEEISKREYYFLKRIKYPHLRRNELSLFEDNKSLDTGSITIEKIKSLFLPCEPKRFKYYRGTIVIIVNGLTEIQIEQLKSQIKIYRNNTKQF